MRSLRRSGAGLAMAAVLALAGCTGSSGDPEPSPSGSADADGALRPKLEAFSRIAVTAPYQLNIVDGSAPALVIEAAPELHSDVVADVVDGTLTLGFQGGPLAGPIVAELTLPVGELTALEVRGASNVQASDQVTGESLEVVVSAASTVTLPASVDSLNLAVDGAGAATLSGEADTATVTASGASRIDMSKFAAGDATVTATAASSVRIAVTGALEANAGSASTIRYSGQPTSVKRTADITSTVEPD
jgi:hypothetical protein